MSKETLELLNILGQIATVVTGLAAIIALAASRGASKAQNIVAAIGVLNSTEAQAARHKAKSGKTAEEVKRWNAAERADATVVCNTYDLAGILVRQGVVNDKTILDDWGASIEHNWEKFEALIAERRDNSGETHWKNFKYLYDLAVRRKSGR